MIRRPETGVLSQSDGIKTGNKDAIESEAWSMKSEVKRVLTNYSLLCCMFNYALKLFVQILKIYLIIIEFPKKNTALLWLSAETWAGVFSVPQ